MATRKAVKKVRNAVLYDDGLIRISNVRISYPHLKKPYKGDDDKGEAKYGLVALLPKGTHAEAKKLINDQINAMLAENKVKALAADKKFLRDGDESGKEENADCWTVSARESRRPTLREINEDGELIEVERENADEVFYGGCWGSILIRPWYQNNKFGKRMNAGLSAVTKKKDDEAFGEGRISEEEVDEAFEDDDDIEEQTSRKRKPSRYEDDDEDERPARRSRRPAEDDDPDDL